MKIISVKIVLYFKDIFKIKIKLRVVVMANIKYILIFIKLLIIILIFLLIPCYTFLTNPEVSGIYIIDTNSSNSRTITSTILNWTQKGKSDFLNGSLRNLTLTENGEVGLSLEMDYIEDSFTDEFKIARKENVIVNTDAGNVKLSQFFKTFGGKNHDEGYDIKQTKDGGYIISGVMDWKILLLKIDKDGNEEWNKTINGDWGYSVQETSDGGYIITGLSITSDLLLVKTNNTGNIEWTKIFGGIWADGGNSVKQTKDGGYIVGGWTQSYGYGTNGADDFWLIKTDAKGNEIWNKTYGGKDSDTCFEVIPTVDNGYILFGHTFSFGEGYPDGDIWIIKTNSKGIEQWNKTYGGPYFDFCNSAQNTSDGGYIISGSKEQNNEYDPWLIKINNNGTELWNKTYDKKHDSFGRSVQQTPDGGFILTGEIYYEELQSHDVFLLKTDSNGHESWFKSYGGDGTEAGRSLLVDSNGNYVVIGNTESYGEGERDILLYKTNKFGNFLGTMVSKNLLSDQNVYSINTFEYESFIPKKTSLKVQFSQDQNKWFNSIGNLNGWDNLLNGSNSINLSLLNWTTPNLYYKIIFNSSNIMKIPVLKKILITYEKYLLSGIYESEQFNSKTFPNWEKLSFSATEPQGSEIKFQIRTADTEENLTIKKFTGPNGTINSFYNTSGQSIWLGNNRNQWMQYKIYLSTINSSLTPLLKAVTITYYKIDTDNDSIPDFNDTDDDNDNIPDNWEFKYGFNSLNKSDAIFDPDLDGLTNYQEFLNSSNPNNNDTDGDNLGDGFEVIFSKTNPANWDSDGNGIGDGLEFLQKFGYTGGIKTLPNDWIGMTIKWSNYTMLVSTNSSVLEAKFDKDNKKLDILLSGVKGTIGICNISIPKNLINSTENISIKLDGKPLNFTMKQTKYNYYIMAKYKHSTHKFSANFSQIGKEPIEPTPIEPSEKDDDDSYANYILLVLIIIILIIIIIVFALIKIRTGNLNNNIPQLPPEQLSKILEKKYTKGGMTEDTYKDIKSQLNKYKKK